MSAAIDISKIPTLTRIVKEIDATRKPRKLKWHDKIVAVLTPVSHDKDAIFDQLCENGALIRDAEKTKKQFSASHSTFTNLTKKYSYLLKPQK